jgi:hypothetical protein
VTGDQPKGRSFPDLVQKEALGAGLAFAFVCVMAAAWDAPIQGPADEAGIPADNVKAPWIFVGIQQALKHLPSLAAGIVLPLTVVLVLMLLPFLGEDRKPLAGRLFAAIILSTIALTLWGYFA